MRRKTFILAHLGLALSLTAAGCSGPVREVDQAAVPPRDSLAPMGYADAGSSGGNDRPHTDYVPPFTPGRNDEYSPDQYMGSTMGPSMGYGADLSNYTPQYSLERDRERLRQSEQAQENALRELYQTPNPHPETLRDEERKLEEIRQKITVYDLALAKQPQNTRARDTREQFDAMPERVQAMAAPRGFSFPPRSEVRLPSNPHPSAKAVETVEEDQERVIWDPRRDGDLPQFVSRMSSGESSIPAAQSMPDDDFIPSFPAESSALPARRDIVIPLSLPPAARAEQPQAGKPFAGAPVNRAFPRSKPKPEAVATEPPPANLFSQSSAPEEVQSRPGLFSADGREEKADWPSLRPPQSMSPLPETAKRLGKPQVEIPAPMPSAKPVVTIEMPKQPVKPAPAQAKKVPTVEVVDEVFVPDLFFSGR